MMSTLKKILIYFVLALYLVTSVGPVSVFAHDAEEPRGEEASEEVVSYEETALSEEEFVPETAEKEESSVSAGNPLRTAEPVPHGESDTDGDITLVVTLDDPNVYWDGNNPVKYADQRDAGIKYQYTVRLNLNEETYKEYQAGEICISLPKSILLSRSSYNSTTRSLDKANSTTSPLY
ncbi:MAG: hypothetical protein IIZ48_02095, partial [Erysipelotrichales bacterium]|nr:hypothetical protein [Erysipelotrichales bacterium]